MFALLFIITTTTGDIAHQYSGKSYVTLEECMSLGWLEAARQSDYLGEKYPNMQYFDVVCAKHGKGYTQT